MSTIAGTKRLIRNLHTRKGRRKTGLTLLEGPRLVAEAVAASADLRVVVIADDFEAPGGLNGFEEKVLSGTAPVLSIPRAEFDELATTDTPSGILAVGALPERKLTQLEWTNGIILVLDGIQDPGNAGALVRTAWALGASAVVSLEGSAGVSNPKVLRGSMGGVFRLPVVESSRDAFLTWMAEQEGAIWVADTKGEKVTDCDIPRKLALVVGNEGAGVTRSIETRSARTVAVSISPTAESLNVVVAAGILIHEVMRDR